jgi:hypothetical protein
MEMLQFKHMIGDDSLNEINCLVASDSDTSKPVTAEHTLQLDYAIVKIQLGAET